MTGIHNFNDSKREKEIQSKTFSLIATEIHFQLWFVTGCNINNYFIKPLSFI